MSESVGALPSTAWLSPPFTFTLTSLVPSLLHVYWFLHALHLVLGAYALRAWWQGSILNLQLPTSSPTFHAYSRTRTSAEPRDVSKHQQGTGAPSAHLPPALRSSASSEVGSTVYRLLPWLLLALLFYIPGVYLECPADTWAHYARINEWHVLANVTVHSSWMKSSYFIPYSLLSWCVGLRQIFWLDFYYTGICLLLCWQYYRLARACDLSERASMMFVLLQALLFGNNIFSFYRYYGISSSIYAQLGAVALTRIVLEAAKHPQLSLRFFFSISHFISQLTAYRLPPALRSSAPSEVGSVQPPIVYRTPSTFAGRLARTNAPAQAGGRSLGRQQATTGHTGMAAASNGAPPPSVYRLLLSVLCILPLIRYNHAQGLGIAGLGIGAIIIWRLIEWRRSALWWLIVTTLVINALFLWLYPRPAMVEIHRAQGFLNAWYGFNILNLASSAGDRMLQIISVFGIINLAAALVLICRNHVIAWLTILPIAVMLLPCIAVPLEQVLAQTLAGPDNVITFQRFFFAIPSGLAIVCCLREAVTKAHTFSILTLKPAGAFFALMIIVAGFVILPPSNSAYNRFWHFIQATPQDLQLGPVLPLMESTAARVRKVDDSAVISAEAVGFVFNSFHPDSFPVQGRTIRQSVTPSLEHAVSWILSGEPPAGNKRVPLNQDPFAADPSAWTATSGPAPQFIRNITHFPLSTFALQNPPGQSSQVFSAAAIPIEPTKTYGLEFSLRQFAGTQATTYLAVAWYNAAGDLLASNLAAPGGAGTPTGWVNGSFSYFGLIANVVPTHWTTYRKSFGPGTETAIPPHARSVRIGALLNYNAIPQAVVQMTNVRLWQKNSSDYLADGTFPQNAHIFVVAPGPGILLTPASQAGQLTRHWPAQQLATQFGGGPELRAAALAASAGSVNTDEMCLERKTPPLAIDP